MTWDSLGTKQTSVIPGETQDVPYPHPTSAKLTKTPASRRSLRRMHQDPPLNISRWGSVMLRVQRYVMMTSSNGSISCVTEGNPPVIDAVLSCFLWSAPEETVGPTIGTTAIWNTIAPIMTILWRDNYMHRIIEWGFVIFDVVWCWLVWHI